MDYEVDLDAKPINFRLLALLCICAAITGFLFYPMFKPQPVKVIEPLQNVSQAIEIRYIEVPVTQAPDGLVFFASEYQTGIRKINRPFSFYGDNVTGKKDMRIITRVYDYKIFTKLHWYNPSDTHIYEMLPSSGNKYLFVFYNMMMDDITAQDARFFMPSFKNFVVQDMNIAGQFYPLEYPYQINIKELEYSYNLNDDSKVKHFSGHREYSTSLSEKSTAGEIWIKHNILRGGISNSEDGYILYEIPIDTKEENLIVGINFYSWGDAYWKLKP